MLLIEEQNLLFNNSTISIKVGSSYGLPTFLVYKINDDGKLDIVFPVSSTDDELSFNELFWSENAMNLLSVEINIFDNILLFLIQRKMTLQLTRMLKL